jgi:hypothetical protein
MRKKLIIKLGILGLAAIFLLSMASYSTVQEVTTQGKPDKPDKPGKSKTEWIAFDGDLVGGQPVDGCCPNAGPFPEYTMTLPFEAGGFPPGTCHDGYLFINGYGAGRNNAYIVQFWNDDLKIFVEIIGGVMDYDKKNKILTVTFENEECFDYYAFTTTLVSFTLVRRPY